MTQFDPQTFDVIKFDAILARGLSNGLGDREGSMCIEAAICTVLDLPHGDDPGCVAESVRNFKIALNDKNWSTPKARAKGLRDLGLAQLGSKGVINNAQFCKLLSEKVIRVLIPDLYRKIFKDNPALLQVALRCEQEGTKDVARDAYDAARDAHDAANAAYYANAAYAARAAANAAYYAAAYAAAYAADAARDAYDAANAAAASNANAAAANAAARDAYAAANANAAAHAANANTTQDYYLNLCAKLALDTLQELNSPGCVLLKA